MQSKFVKKLIKNEIILSHIAVGGGHQPWLTVVASASTGNFYYPAKSFKLNLNF